VTLSLSISRYAGVDPVNVPTVCAAPAYAATTPLAETTGATPSTSGARVASVRARASSIVSWRALVFVPVVVPLVPPPSSAAKAAAPPPRPPPVVEVDEMVSVLLPSRLIEAATLALDPVPTATRMITAATPMRMPRVVSAERSLFEVTPSTANRELSRKFMTPPSRTLQPVAAPGAGRKAGARRRGSARRAPR